MICRAIGFMRSGTILQRGAAMGVDVIRIYEVTVDKSAIVQGGTYSYHGLPKKCQGHLYRVLDTDIIDVPSYQHKVLVECVTGPDAGMKFTCTLDNFIRRYRLESFPQQENNKVG